MRISDWSSDVCSSDLALQHFGALPGAAGAVREAGFAARDLADRGDHRGGAAGEAFGQAAAFGIGLPLVDRIGLLAHRQARVLRQLDDRVAGDAGQDRAGPRRRYDAAVIESEEHVHAAEFLAPAISGGFEATDLVVPLVARPALPAEAAGHVADAFSRPR